MKPTICYCVIVDDIESNVVRAHDYVDEGNVQLDKAVTYQVSGWSSIRLALLLVIKHATHDEIQWLISHECYLRSALRYTNFDINLMLSASR